MDYVRHSLDLAARAPLTVGCPDLCRKQGCFPRDVIYQIRHLEFTEIFGEFRRLADRALSERM